MSRWLIERQLRRTARTLRALRDDLRVTDEQAAQLRSDADDLDVDAVLGRAGAGPDARRAGEQVAAIERHRRHLLDRIAALEARQDELLDRMAP